MTLPGIDTDRIYFREEIAALWGRDESEDPDNTRRWFKTNFLSRGLKVCVIGRRIVVHGAELSEWVLRTSTLQVDD